MFGDLHALPSLICVKDGTYRMPYYRCMENPPVTAIARAGTWRTLTAAPHRPMFLAGALQGVLVMAWWLADLVGRYGAGPYLPWTVAAPAAHAYLMLYGFFPLFIFGFLFTTYPAWLDAQKLSRQRYTAVFLLMAIGHLMFYMGLATSSALAISGVMLVLVGWGAALTALGKILLQAPHPDKRHAYVTTVALTLGWFGVAAFAGWLLTGEPLLLAFSVTGGLWLFLLPVVFTVSHRMIPFFSDCVLDDYTVVRPFGWLWLALAAMAMHAVLALLDSRWLWIPDLLLTLAAFYLAVVWQFWRSLKIRLLAVLHLSFLWLGIGAALYTTQSLAVFLSAVPVLGLAPLHAVAIGYCASMILAMASRVTLGHSGRTLLADRATWLVFLGFQGAAIARIAFEILPGRPVHALFVAAGIWLASYGAWAFKYAPYYWRPRIDGRDG
jgi:uncharacterized protein involved in response to NO